jgi:hypothetical protein
LKETLNQKNKVSEDIKALKQLRKKKEYYKETKERRKELSL